mgnify:CR=1 FL=1
MPDKLYDYADYIKLRLVINLHCSSRRIIILVGKMGCYPAPDKLSMCFWPYSRSCEDGYDLAHTKGCTKTAG